MDLSQDRLRLDILDQCFPQTSLLADSFWFRKITTDDHILADLNAERPDDWYPKLNIYVSELILDSYKYITMAHVKMYCVI
jgi:hypothetical protein